MKNLTPYDIVMMCAPLLFCIAIMLPEKEQATASIANYQDTFDLQFIESIPGNANNFRSKQLTADQLTQLCKHRQITRVIRMNGDGKDSAGVSIQEEKDICNYYGIHFQYINIDAKKGEEYRINQLLKLGNCLIHCRHGYDRTGAMVGYHLRQNGYSKKYVIEHNDWNDYVERKGKRYQKYFDYIN